MLVEPIAHAAAAYAGQRATLTPPAAPASSAAAGTAASSFAGLGAGATPETDFGAFIDRQAAQAVETLKQGERASLAAVAGKASAHEVVRSVLAAEMTVQTVVSIRDRMVQAYQDIMRMAI